MASSLSRGFLPTSSLSSLSSSSSSSSSAPSSSSASSSASAATAIPKWKSCKARSSLQSAGPQQEQLTTGGDRGRSGEMLVPAVRCSRREIIGLGAMLATAGGLGMAIAPPEARAATEECAKLTETPSGLSFCDTAVGSGISASKGLLIKAHYSGRLENGKVFDSSYSRGKPLVFRVGVGEVIRGWDQGIVGTEGIPPMLAGGKRTLKIPSQLGYGERGAGCRGGTCIIPPNSVLIFDVEFVGKA